MAEEPQQAEHVNTAHQAIPVAIQPMPEFKPEAHVGASLATRWDKWLSDFEMFIVASGITDPKRKRALLLYQAGTRAREIFRSLPETSNDEAYDTAKQRLKEYFDRGAYHSKNSVRDFCERFLGFLRDFWGFFDEFLRVFRDF